MSARSQPLRPDYKSRDASSEDLDQIRDEFLSIPRPNTAFFRQPLQDQLDQALDQIGSLTLHCELLEGKVASTQKAASRLKAEKDDLLEELDELNTQYEFLQNQLHDDSRGRRRGMKTRMASPLVGVQRVLQPRLSNKPTWPTSQPRSRRSTCGWLRRRKRTSR